MSESGVARRRRRLWEYVVLAGLVAALCLTCLTWYVTTDSFQAMVRRRLVKELEQITGGKVELGSIHTVPFHFQVEVRNLTIHGREAATDIPYVHVDSLTAEIKVTSALGAELGFHSIVLDHPVVHLLFYPDGGSNQPQPTITRIAQENHLERLFSLAISRLEVKRGELLWQDQSIPLDFAANDVSADMSYSILHAHYTGNLSLAKVETKFANYRPVDWKAEAHFSLGDQGVEVQSLKLSSGPSHIEASGGLQDFEDPKLNGKYEVSLDLADAFAIARRSGARSGVLQASGTGSWSSQDFKTMGRVTVKNLDWHDALINSRNSSGSADFLVTPRQLSLSRMDAKLLGGVVTGDANIENRIVPTISAKANRAKTPAKFKKANTAEEQEGLIRLRVKDVSLADFLAAVSSRERPFDRMRLAGITDGTMESRWNDSSNHAETKIAVHVTPPANLLPGQLPVDALAQGIYHSRTGEMEITDFSADTRSTQVRASGTLSSRAAMKLSATTSDLSELQQITTAFDPEKKIPARLHGPASFEGTMVGSLSDPTFTGSLRTENFESLIPTHPDKGGIRLHWDFLAAQMQLSKASLVLRNGVLRRDQETVTFDLSAALEKWKFTDESPFALNLSTHGGDVSEIGLLGYDYPVSGDVIASLHAHGTKTNPHVDGVVELTSASLAGYDIDHFSSKVSFDQGQLSLKDVVLTRGDARVTGSGSYMLATQAYSIELTGSDFQLARVPQLQNSRVNIEGRLDFSARGSGTMNAPIVDAEVRLRNLSFDHEPAGDFRITGVSDGSQLRVTGRSQFKNSELSMDGTVDLHGDLRTVLDLHVNHLDVDPLLRTYLQGRLTGHSAIAGDFELQGPLRRRRELNVVGNLSDVFADVENVKIRNNGPLRFSVSEQYFRLEQFRLIGENTDLAANGSVQLNAEQQLDLHAHGAVNLQLIESYNPDFSSSGRVTVDAAISGTIAKPTMQGKLQVEGASIANIALPSALSDLNGTLIFNQNRVQIETLTAHTGGGLVAFSGSATAYNRQINFDLSVQGTGVRLRYPPGVSSTADANLHWLGSSTASTLSGDVTINKLAITPGFDFGAYLARTSQTSALPQTNPLLNRIRLDVHVVTAPELQMQTAVVRLSGDADLRVRGSAAKAVLLGRADVIEGEAYFNGNKYHVERGDVTFTNPVATTPVVDLQASTHVRDYDITLNLNGKSDTMNLTYRSEPPLPTSDIIALLAFGQTTQTSAQIQGGQSGFSQDTSSAILSAALNATVSNRASRLFGVSHIRFDPQGLETATSPITNSPAVTIEEQVRDNITLTYSTDISQTSQQIIQGVYNVSSNFSIVGLRDQNGVVSFYVRIRKRKN